MLTAGLAALSTPHKKSLNCEAFCSRTGFQVQSFSIIKFYPDLSSVHRTLLYSIAYSLAVVLLKALMFFYIALYKVSSK